MKKWTQSIAIVLVMAILFTMTEYPFGKADSGSYTDVQVKISFDENSTPVATMTAQESCFKEGISKSSITITKVEREVLEDSTEAATETVQPENTTENADSGNDETLVAANVTYTDDKNISFTVEGDIDYSAQYVILVDGDNTVSGDDISSYTSGTQFIQEIIPSVDVEKISAADENPVFEITFKNGTLSPAFDGEKVYLEQGFSSLTIDKMMITTDSVLTVYTKGTPGYLDFEEGQIRLAADNFLNYYNDVTASVAIERSDISLDYDSLKYENGTITADLSLSTGTFNGLPEMVLTESDAAITADALSEDKTTVTVSFATDKQDIDEAFAAIDGAVITVPAEAVSYGHELAETISMPKAMLSSHIDVIEEKDSGYEASVTLSANAGELKDLSADDITISGDFADAKVAECKQSDYGYDIVFTFTNEKGIDENTLNGTLEIKSGHLINMWGTESDRNTCSLYYSTEGDRGLGDTLEEIKTLWGKYGDTFASIGSVASDIGSAYSTTVSVLQLFGVMKSDNSIMDGKLDSIMDQLDSIQADVSEMKERVIKSVDKLSSVSEINADEIKYNTALNQWTSEESNLTELQAAENKYNELVKSFVENWKKSKIIHVYKGSSGELTYPSAGNKEEGYDKTPITETYDVICEGLDKNATLDDIKTYLGNQQVHDVKFDNGVTASMAGDNTTLSIVDGDEVIKAKFIKEDVDAVEFSDGTIVEGYDKGSYKTVQTDDGALYYISDDNKAYSVDTNKYAGDYYSNATMYNVDGKLVRQVNWNPGFGATMSNGKEINTWYYQAYWGNCIQAADGTVKLASEVGTVTTVNQEGKGTGVLQSDEVTIYYPDTGENAALTKQHHEYIEYADGSRAETSIAEESYKANAQERYEALMLQMNYEIMNNSAMSGFDDTYNKFCGRITAGNNTKSFFKSYYEVLSYIYNFDSQAQTDKDNMRSLVAEALIKGKPIASLYQEFHGITINNQKTLNSAYHNALEYTLKTLDKNFYTNTVSDGEAYCYLKGQKIKVHTLTSEAVGYEMNMKGVYVEKYVEFAVCESGYMDTWNKESWYKKGASGGIILDKSYKVKSSGGNSDRMATPFSSANISVLQNRAYKIRGSSFYDDVITVFSLQDSSKELTRIITNTSDVKFECNGKNRIQASELKALPGWTAGKMRFINVNKYSKRKVGSDVDPFGRYNDFVKMKGSIYDMSLAGADATAGECNDYLFGATDYYHRNKKQEWTIYGTGIKYLLFTTD